MDGKHRRRRRVGKALSAVTAVLGLVLLSSGLSAMAAQAAGGEGGSKVFVCKYVGKPGIDERLQTGDNPISVSVNSILDFPGVGKYFKDGQDRSFVLMEDNTPPGPEGDPGLGDCPAPDGPDEIPVPTVPVSDPCGPNNAVYGEVPSGNYTVTRNPDGSITLNASEGYVFPGGKTSVTLPAPTDSGEQCLPNPTPVAPAEPLVLDVCEPPSGGTSDEYTIPSDPNFTYTVNGAEAAPDTYLGTLDTYVVKAIPKQGVVVKEGAVTEWALEFSRAACLTPPNPDPVISPDGSIKVDCRGKGVAVADNSASTTSVGFEVVVGGQATLYSLRAGEVRNIPFSGAKPGSEVILQDGEANELDSARVPGKCGGGNPLPDNPETPVVSNTPTTADTGLWSPSAAPQSPDVAALWVSLSGLLLLVSGLFFYGAARRGQEG